MTRQQPHSQYSHHYTPYPPSPRPPHPPTYQGEGVRHQRPPHPSQTPSSEVPRGVHPQAVYPHPPQAYAYPAAAPATHRTVRPTGRQHPRHSGRSQGMFLAGGGVVALAIMAIVPRPAPEVVKPSENVVCQEKVQSQSVLSRAELSELLSVPERSTKEAVQQVINEPYCTLSSVSVREGAIAEREAYPLEFDPQTWFIVLYEDGEYAGYDFSFRRD